MATRSVIATTTVVSSSQPLAVAELAHACGADVAWVVQLVEVGIVQARIEQQHAPPAQWRFGSSDLQRALAARRLERDFGVGLDAAALILDLEHEVRRLKAVLASRGVD
ncbi:MULTISPECIES: chaperone modulator CbpM [unclassified Variovorax]|uniref:chaperone modulator CbpM n=1 Tax=unclassified Variovorax TaxID=663243 RepID=UPI001BD59467|nr:MULTISPECIES: chaperone modulator CbpM [unclassified Variovorax]